MGKVKKYPNDLLIMKDSRIKYYILILLGWTIFIVSLVVFENNKINEETKFDAQLEARTNFNKDQGIRFWASEHGGIYVTVDSLTQPNPALSHIPERDIETPSGTKLTLMNPAYMVRQLNEYFADYYGIVGHITSKELLRSENKPDKWELAALNQFEKGVNEVSEYSDLKGESHFRLMQPLFIKQSCLKCHGHQGYKVGDVRGGISVSIPMKPILERATKHKKRNMISFAVIWVFGFAGITFGYTKLDKSLHSQEEAEKELIIKNNKLDIYNQELQAAQDHLKDSEEKLHTLFEAMTDMVALYEVVYDKDKMVDCRLLDCNHSFTAMTDFKKEDIVGKLASEVFHTDTSPVLKVFSKVATTGESTQYEIYDPTLDKHFMVSMVSPKKELFATVSTDITVIKQFQEIITAKNKELENYLYVASHDLRSPLVNVQGFSQLLKGHIDSVQHILKEVPLDTEKKKQTDLIFNEKIPQSLNYISGGITKMDTLIKGLLQLSRTGSLVMTIQQIDMNKLIKEVLRVHEFQLNEIKAKTEVENLPDCFGDKTLLNQLFSNIISNAIKYRSDKRALQISIRAKNKYKQIVYCIEDNGIGIEARHLEKIWSIFFQVNPKSPDSGEGLGLSVVKRIVDKHHGKVKVESEEGKWTRIYIELQKNEFSA